MDNIYLPVGSVIISKKNPNLELLVVRCNVTVDDLNKDYLCNIIDDENNKLNFIHINEDDIEKVVFVGYQNL